MNADFPDLEDEFADREFRQAYVDNRVRRLVAYQLRALREDRDLSQQELAEMSGMKQTALSRLENPEYGRPSVSTLLKVAAAYDVALLVRFVDYPTFLHLTKDVSPGALRVEPFAQSAQRHTAAPLVAPMALKPSAQRQAGAMLVGQGAASSALAGVSDQTKYSRGTMNVRSAEAVFQAIQFSPRQSVEQTSGIRSVIRNQQIEQSGVDEILSARKAA